MDEIFEPRVADSPVRGPSGARHRPSRPPEALPPYRQSLSQRAPDGLGGQLWEPRGLIIIDSPLGTQATHYLPRYLSH